MSNPLNLVFAGTPDFAASHLQALLDAGHHISAVYSQPDRPAGRGKKLQASPVKQLAIAQNIDVYQPISLKNPQAQAELAALKPDLMIVVAYGLILPQAVLDIPRLGCWNVHGSLLPRWRGAAPIQRAIWAGDQHTGVTIMQMDKGLDTGAMLLKATLPIANNETSTSLYDKLATLGPTTLLDALAQYQHLQGEPQNDEQANYAHKLSKAEAQLDWSQPASQLERNVRAFTPWPGAFFVTEHGNIKVSQADVSQQSGNPGQILRADKQSLLVATGEGSLAIQRLQIPGKKAMPVADVLNARADWFTPGSQLPLAAAGQR